MKIVVATGIYPPEVGGPSTYAANLVEALESQGHKVSVVLYGTLKKWPTGLRHLLYAIKLIPRTFFADGIIAFDTYSVGLPAALAHFISRTPLIVRVGGDFIWEQYLERTGDLLPLPEFYQHREKWGMKEKITFAITRWILQQAIVVFNTQWLLDLWHNAYRLEEKRIRVIENAVGIPRDVVPARQKNFLFYSRQIALKNAPAFKRAFAAAKQEYPDVRLEEGMIPHAELVERIKGCYAVVVPSISDVAPNYILDAMRAGKPFLLTKHSGYAERFRDYGVIVDPLDETDMVRGIGELANPEVYERLSARIADFNEIHTYDDITREYLAVLNGRI